MPLDEINDTEEDQYKTIESKPLHDLILSECEKIQSLTICKQDLKDVITDICKNKDDSILPAQVSLYVDKIFKSAGSRKELYRVQIKKAILENLEDLKLMQLGQLEPTEKPMINLVLDKLDESKSGLIPKRELKQAVR